MINVLVGVEAEQIVARLVEITHIKPRIPGVVDFPNLRKLLLIIAVCFTHYVPSCNSHVPFDPKDRHRNADLLILHP